MGSQPLKGIWIGWRSTPFEPLGLRSEGLNINEHFDFLFKYKNTDPAPLKEVNDINLN